jgi:hypothetical protein
VGKGVGYSVGLGVGARVGIGVGSGCAKKKMCKHVCIFICVRINEDKRKRTKTIIRNDVKFSHQLNMNNVPLDSSLELV